MIILKPYHKNTHTNLLLIGSDPNREQTRWFVWYRKFILYMQYNCTQRNKKDHILTFKMRIEIQDIIRTSSLALKTYFNEVRTKFDCRTVEKFARKNISWSVLLNNTVWSWPIWICNVSIFVMDTIFQWTYLPWKIGSSPWYCCNKITEIDGRRIVNNYR